MGESPHPCLQKNSCKMYTEGIYPLCTFLRLAKQWQYFSQYQIKNLSRPKGSFLMEIQQMLGAHAATNYMSPALLFGLRKYLWVQHISVLTVCLAYKCWNMFLNFNTGLRGSPRSCHLDRFVQSGPLPFLSNPDPADLQCNSCCWSILF